MFRAIKRVFIWLGLMAEKATETDAINEAVVERGIRDSKAKADKAHYANGQLAGQIALLKDQIKSNSASVKSCKVSSRPRRRLMTRRMAPITPKNSRRSKAISRTINRKPTISNS